MPEPSPPVDRAVAGSVLAAPLAILLVLAALGGAILASRHLAGLIRGLDQQTPASIPVEPR